MFGFLKKTEDEEIYSPVIGECIPLDEVPDKVFADKMVGEGIGLIFEDGTICSPCDGRVIMIAVTKHAIGIRSSQGNEILVHIGLETVEYNGEGFEILVKEDEKVKAHQPIMKVDVDFFKSENVNLTSPLVVTNVERENVEVANVNKVDLNSVVLKIKKGDK